MVTCNVLILMLMLMYYFSVEYNIIDNSNIINIHKYLMKKHDIKQCLSL